MCELPLSPQVYQACTNWVRWDVDGRAQYLHALLNAIHIYALPPKFLKNQLQSCPILSKVPPLPLPSLWTPLDLIVDQGLPLALIVDQGLPLVLIVLSSLCCRVPSYLRVGCSVSVFTSSLFVPYFYLPGQRLQGLPVEDLPGNGVE